MPSQRAKNWCFTINNYTEDELQLVKRIGEDHESHGVHCLVYGLEVGDSGTPHIQGFISYNEKQTLRSVKGLLSQRLHGEIARDPHRAFEYCKKDGEFEQFGSAPKRKGRRTDILEVQEAIRTGATIYDIQDRFFNFYAKYPKAIKEYADRFTPARDWETEVQVLWGETGTGKTRFVHETVKEERRELYMHPGESWFDGYTGQEDVLFDDFNGSEFKLAYLLKLLDRYGFRVPVKGAYVQWVPKRIWITSNKDPQDWYANCHSEQRAALRRRFTKVTHFARIGSFSQ